MFPGYPITRFPRSPVPLFSCSLVALFPSQSVESFPCSSQWIWKRPHSSKNGRGIFTRWVSERLISIFHPLSSLCLKYQRRKRVEDVHRWDAVIRDLKQWRRQRQWKRHLKNWVWVLSNLIASIWTLSICQMQGDFSWSWIRKDFIQVQKERGKFVVACPRPPLNFKLGFTSWSCSGRQRNVLKSMMHLQSCCFDH